MKIFIDTNIFLDLILKRKNFIEASIILNAIEKKLYQGVILDVTILNIDYIAKKQVKNIKEFLFLINSQFDVIGGTNDMIDFALKIKNSDLEDNLQYISAKNSKCDLIISNDKNFYNEDIKVISSVAFVNQYF